MADLPPLKTFICYAQEDRKIVEGLLKHLSLLEKKQLLAIWDDGKILPGEEWDKTIKSHLENADLVLLFVSVDFLHSDYIEKTELQAALQRHREGKAALIPIIVRPCDWMDYFEIGKFQALPAQARPIQSSHFPIMDEACYEVAQGIKATALDLRERQAHAAAAVRQANAVKSAAERLRLRDEAAWSAADTEAGRATSNRDKISAYEVYLEDEDYTLHRKEAEKRINALTAAETKQKIAAKKQAVAASKPDAPKQQTKAPEKASKAVQTPVPQPDHSLFPLFGVTLGKTTVAELARLGTHAKMINSNTGKPYNCYEINGLDFWYDEKAAHRMYIVKTKPMPLKWVNMGFRWELSYEQWLNVLTKLGYALHIVKQPSVVEFNNGYDSFSAAVTAVYRKTEIPYILDLDFNYSDGTTIHDPKTLYAITIRLE